MGGSVDWVLRELRATRAAPPGRAAADGDRRAVYNAALQQFEELLAAARAVGPASRPLPLFYALSQAGRAIVAAGGDVPSIIAHGLSEYRYRGREHPPAEFLHRRIKRTPDKLGRDAFGAVARASGSGELTGSVELGAVWAATPNTHRLPEGTWLPSWRRALDVSVEPRRAEDGGDIHVLLMSMGGNPLLTADEVLADASTRYPTLAPGTRVAARRSKSLPPGEWIADAWWNPDEASLEAVAPLVEMTTGGHQIIPLLPDQAEQLSPLMLWWVLLFGLSIFARYEPGLWGRALDVSRDVHAVPLEALLDKALDLMPRLVYEPLLALETSKLPAPTSPDSPQPPGAAAS